MPSAVMDTRIRGHDNKGAIASIFTTAAVFVTVFIFVTAFIFVTDFIFVTPDLIGGPCLRLSWTRAFARMTKNQAACGIKNSRLMRPPSTFTRSRNWVR